MPSATMECKEENEQDLSNCKNYSSVERTEGLSCMDIKIDTSSDDISNDECVEKCNSNGNAENVCQLQSEDISKPSSEVAADSSLNSENNVCCDIYNFECIPVQVTGAWKEFELVSVDNFTKGCKWSPDGSCLLSCSDDNALRIFNLPTELWQEDFSWEKMSEMFSVLKISEGELIYDYAWYPHMTSNDPTTCCLASSSRSSPVHLWDAFTGELRCSYRPYNHVDELVAAHSLAFDFSGQKLYCGFNKVIRIFDVSLPGRTFEERRTYAKKCGQTGIISCFAFSSSITHMSAAGSYAGTVGVYAEPLGGLEYLLVGHQGGITHICFSPDGTKLFSGGRVDPEILCWDMRNLKNALFSMRRISRTNQRLYFDVSRCGKYLISGNHNGVVTVWDLTKPPIDVTGCPVAILEPVQFYQAHNDCVNGISLNPALPLLATSSGQRHFPEPVDSDEEPDDTVMFTCKNITRENSLRLWWVGCSNDSSKADVNNK